MVCALILTVGCTRSHYRISADRDSYFLLDANTLGTPWLPPPGFSILPSPISRLFDPTPIANPQLPVPAPQLYAYELPEIKKRDPARFRPEISPGQGSISAGNEAGKLPELLNPPREVMPPQAAVPAKRGDKAEVIRGHWRDGIIGADKGIRPAAFHSIVPGHGGLYADEQTDGELRIIPIPKDIWKKLPPKCLRRMFEFQSMRDEYKDTFDKAPGKNLRDQSQRLALEDIVELALINSRAYQTQKEQLYTAALRLSFERYQFQCKFTPFNNGTDVFYIHNRTRGITTNTLDVPTQFNADKILATGGTLLARFANNVLLTFNGPEGFAADINSELLFDVTQSVFQRDIVFEPLTQSERDVVYAARDFARFRKAFFRDLAFQYYSLLNTYRNIEIAGQDYFTNLRAFGQLEAEFRVGKQSRIQVDQVEQRALSSRSNLIATCNTLESDLDNLKFAIGIPPELPLNLDLTELDEITLRDQATIATEMVRRSSRDLGQVLRAKNPDLATLVNGSINLTRRLFDAMELRKKLGDTDTGRAAVEDALPRLLVEEAELTVRENRFILMEQKRAKPPAPPLFIYKRTTELIDSLRIYLRRQVNLALRKKIAANNLADITGKQQDLARRRKLLEEEYDEVISKRQLNRIKEIVQSAETLLADTDALATVAAKLLGRAPLQLQKAIADADVLLAASRKITGDEFDLPAIDLDMDDGMLTAMTQRYELMNLRGIQADQWRRVKLAADDLKSILNLRATQIIRTDSRHNRPFAFTFDDSETRLTMEFDAPLNRKAQRNAFRLSLINYQVARRNLMELEDVIKIAVRDDLRALQLDREQYRIAVASAALAFERVVSTREQLQLGKPGVTARDFVEAQQAYAGSLRDVARQHIGYIQDRISLFLDLELLTVNTEGYWPKLYDENYQPTPRYELPPTPPYGTLPSHIWYSHWIKRMQDIPPGHTMNFNPDPPDRSGDGQAAEPQPQNQPPAPPERLPPPAPAPANAILGRPR